MDWVIFLSEGKELGGFGHSGCFPLSVSSITPGIPTSISTDIAWDISDWKCTSGVCAQVWCGDNVDRRASTS